MESSGGDVTALDKMQLLIGRQMRVLITDGRLIQGEFQCIDSDMNIILNDATEFHGVEDVTSKVEQQGYITRYLGMAMAPGPHVIKVLALKETHTAEEL